MNLQHLRYFVTLAKLEHYTRASEELNITQPSLSYAISVIEEELNVKLFEKNGRNIYLTKTGKMFLGFVEASLNRLDTGADLMRKIGNGEGKIELAFLQILGTHFIPELVQAYLQQRQKKQMSFQFHSGVTTQIIKGIKDQTYDAAFCSFAEEPMVDFYPVAKQELVLIVPEGHRLAKRDVIDLQETLPYPQIIFSKTSGLRPVVDALFDKIDGTYKTAYEVEVDTVIAGLVANNFGIAVVPDMPVLNSLTVKKIQIINPQCERLVYLAVPNNRYIPPIVTDFKCFVLQYVQNRINKPLEF
jgi:DNA-binding transcriptional LysR family regulator